MNQWEIVDCMEPLDEGEKNPRIPVYSETELRQALNRLRGRRPADVLLENPMTGTLSITIGGPFGAFGWLPRRADMGSKGEIVALPDRIYSPTTIDCVGEGIPTPIRADELFPVEDVVEAVVHYYKTSRLPEWIKYREWNPSTLTWEIKPARIAMRRATAS